MLTITVSGEELWDAGTETFSTFEDTILELEHSLISLSKWESKHKKAFLGPEPKSTEEVIDYIKIMVLTPSFPSEIFSRLSPENLTDINEYLDSSESATTFANIRQTKGRSEIITAELIYFWMVNHQIPFECQYWHLNRLFALIRICNIKNLKDKKMSKSDRAAMIQERRNLNAQRKEQLGTTG